MKNDRYKNVNILYVFLIIIFTKKAALACDDICSPLSQVIVSQKGAERIFELILNNTFDSIQSQVENVATFKDFHIDNSTCPKIKLYQAVTQSEKCLGMIDFRKFTNENPDADAELTGYKADLKKLNLDKLGMNLVTPVKCQDWNCHFRVKIKDIKISGQLQAHYADTGKEIFPAANISVSSNQDAAIYYDINLKVDPKTGNINNVETKSANTGLNNLVQVVPNSSSFSISKTDLNFQLQFKKDNLPVNRKNIFKQSFEGFKEKLNDDKWILEQYQKMQLDPFNRYRKSQNTLLPEKKVLEKVHAANQRWQSSEDYEKAFESIPNDILELVNAAGEQQLIAESKYLAAKNGVSEFAAYNTMKNLEAFTNKILADNNFLSKSLSPYLNQEMGSAIENHIQETLRNASQFWDMISKVPLDNNETIAMDTEFLIQELDKTQNLLKMNLMDKKDNCFKANSQFVSSSDGNDFDMQTSFTMSSLNKFFTRAINEKKLYFCNVESKIKCHNGVLFNIKSAPKITCEDGKLLLNFQDNEVKPFNLLSASSSAAIQAEVYNCDGSPCLKLKNLSSKFKSPFLSLPFDSALNKGINAQFSGQNKKSINIPSFHLKKVQSQANCQTTFDWDIGSK